jgi:CRISPR-associated protein Csm5
MPMPFLQNYPYYVTPLSPIHLGCDQGYAPYSFVIENELLYHAEPSQFANRLDHTAFAEFANLAKPGQCNLGNLQRFADKHKNALISGAAKPVLVSAKIASEYHKKLSNLQAEFNQFDIERTAYDCVKNSYLVPGSALKGAMRTAILNVLAKGNPSKLPIISMNRYDGKKDAETQKKLMGGSFSSDPMRLIKISDAAGHADTAASIKYATMVKRSKVDDQVNVKQTLRTFRESILPGQLNTFTGQITLNDFGQGNKDLPGQQFSLPDIIRACNDFYWPIFKDELRALIDLNVLNKAWKTGVTKLVRGDFASAIERNECMLVRVGRNSGAESITIDGVRSIKIMEGKAESYRSKPTTYWLESASGRAAEMMPFGWAVIRFDSGATAYDAPLANLFSRYQEILAEAKVIQQQRREEIAELLAKEARIIAEREAKNKAEQEAARAKAEALANMSPQQQAIQAVLDGLDNASYKNAGAGTEYDISIKATLIQATNENWSSELKSELKQAASQGAKYLGIDPKKNKKFKELLKGLNK